MTSNDTPVARYGSGWVNVVAIPTSAFRSICQKITEQTQYAISDENFTSTSDNEYVTTVASINENKKPEISMIQPHPENEGEFVKFSLGSAVVGDAYVNLDIDDVAVGFIAFTVGLNKELPIGTDTVPVDAESKVKFNKLGPVRILAAAPADQLGYFDLSNKFDYYKQILTDIRQGKVLRHVHHNGITLNLR